MYKRQDPDFGQKINDIVDDYGDDTESLLVPHNPFSSSKSHVTTPDRVYFNDDTPLPARSTSIMDRRLRMETEDYAVYAERFNMSRR